LAQPGARRARGGVSELGEELPEPAVAGSQAFGEVADQAIGQPVGTCELVEQAGGPLPVALDVLHEVDQGFGHQDGSPLHRTRSTVAPLRRSVDPANAWKARSALRGRGWRSQVRWRTVAVMAATTSPGSIDVSSASSETVDLYGAFPRLSEEHLLELSRHGVRRDVERGDVLFREGDRRCDLFVILEGRVAIVESYGTADQAVVGVHGPGRFVGETSTLKGQAVFLTAVVVDSGEVLAVPADRLRQIVADDEELGNVILRAYLIRRSLMVDHGIGLRIVGSRYSRDTARLRDFAARNRIPHRWIDLDHDEQAEALLRDLGIAPSDTPVVIWHGEVLLRNPRNEELARIVGLRPSGAAATTYDLIVVGGGPAGLAAAVYGASEGLDTVVIDAVATGGQAGRAARIENYLGFPSGISGDELAERAVLQAEKFDATITVPAEAAALEQHDGLHVVEVADGERMRGRTVVIATGVDYRRLDVPGLDALEGISVFHAATPSEARLCQGEPVAVVGGGNSAAQAALFLSDRAGAVRLIVREDQLARTMSRYLVDRIERRGSIELLLHSEVREAFGSPALEQLVVEDIRTGERRIVAARALFVFIGAEPRVGWLGGEIALDERGYIRTGPDAFGSSEVWQRARPPRTLQTSRPGVLAVGDVRSGSIKRVAAAVGEGATAVRMCHEYLAEIWGYYP
jgi:thioredoxin reductase (NADPH)